ncbi:MAG: S1/P1 nuclease [Bacteroidia bacterium]|nr:S1/P1 nuclease [Bacteroidia bacterium]
MKNIKLSFLFIFFPVLSIAWSAGGHNMGGAVAYYYLKQHHPDVLQKSMLSLQKHPWYQTRWADTIAKMDPENKEVAIFMLASTWPDEVRKNPELGGGEKTKWHYINYPFAKMGDTVITTLPDKINAVEKLNSLVAILKTQEESEAKAINLCWLFHILEDLHQPLHTIGLFDVQHPHGDRGGNDTYIKFGDTTAAIVLHGYWDRLIRGDFKQMPCMSKKIMKKYKYRNCLLKELKTNISVEDWVKKESWEQAVTAAYRNGAINGTATFPTLVKRKPYDKMCRKIAERRVVLSGIRLAKILVFIYT